MQILVVLLGVNIILNFVLTGVYILPATYPKKSMPMPHTAMYEKTRVVYLLKTHSGTPRTMPGNSVWMCSKPGYNNSIDVPSQFEGYEKLAYKMQYCWHNLCEHYAGERFAVVQLDDDTYLQDNISWPEDRNLCDQVTRVLNTKCGGSHFVDEPSLAGKKTTFCLGYFWYLSPAAVAQSCRSFHLMRHYRPDDVTFSLWWADLGVQFQDITQVPIVYNTCTRFPGNSYVKSVECPPED